MKLLLYTNTVYKIGGVARVSTFFANHWVKNHDITIIATNPDYQRKDLVYDLDDRIEVVNDPEMYVCDASYRLSDASRAKVKQFIMEGDFDIVLALEGKYAVALAPALDEFNGKKIAWMHNSFDAYFKTEGDYLWKLDAVFKKQIALYDTVVVLTKQDKHDFDAAFSLDTLCIINPITFPIKPVAKVSTSKRFITVCRVVYRHKGLDLLLEALPHVFNKHPDWTWYLVGDGPDLKDLQSYIKVHGLTSNVIVCGSTDNVSPYYEEASFFVLPSRWEGMPMASLEALSFSLPVVGFEIGALKEVLGHTLADKLLVKKYDTKALAQKINDLIENPSFRQEVSVLASRRVFHFVFDEVAKKWDKLLDL